MHENGIRSAFDRPLASVGPHLLDESGIAECHPMSSAVRDEVVALLVEDDDAVMEAMCSLLSLEYEVVCVSSLIEARAVLRKRSVTVIVLDLMLRGESSAELIAELARQTVSPPVVLVSASPEAAHIARRYGIAFMQKPFDIDEFLSTVATSREQRRRPVV